jgi:hypothetical protein
MMPPLHAETEEEWNPHESSTQGAAPTRVRSWTSINPPSCATPCVLIHRDEPNQATRWHGIVQVYDFASLSFPVTHSVHNSQFFPLTGSACCIRFNNQGVEFNATRRTAIGMRIEQEDRPSHPEFSPGPAVESAEEFEVVVSAEGTLIFSWNSPDIQDLARLLGVPEFDPPRWCG